MLPDLWAGYKLVTKFLITSLVLKFQAVNKRVTNFWAGNTLVTKLLGRSPAFYPTYGLTTRLSLNFWAGNTLVTELLGW